MWQPFLFEVFKYAKILFPFLPVTHFMLTVGKQLQAFNVTLVNPVRITPLFWSKVVSGLLDWYEFSCLPGSKLSFQGHLQTNATQKVDQRFRLWKGRDIPAWEHFCPVAMLGEITILAEWISKVNVPLILWIQWCMHLSSCDSWAALSCCAKSHKAWFSLH